MEPMSTIDIIKDPVIGPLVITSVIFIPAITVNGLMGSKFGFNLIMIASFTTGILLSYLIKKVET